MITLVFAVAIIKSSYSFNYIFYKKCYERETVFFSNYL